MTPLLWIIASAVVIGNWLAALVSAGGARARRRAELESDRINAIAEVARRNLPRAD